MNSPLTTKSSLPWNLAAIEFRTIFRWVIGGVFMPAAWLGVSTNPGLMWMLAVLWPRGLFGKGFRRGGADEAGASRVGGFTILEMLVVIAVVAVLLAITLPSLRTARSSAGAVAGSSNLRQLAASVTMYGGDWQGSFPTVATPGTPFFEVNIKGWKENGYQRPYFSASVRFWPSVVVPSYGELIPGLMRSDGDDPSSAAFRFSEAGTSSGTNPVVWSNAWLTHTADAQSRYWDEDEPPEDLSLLRTLRLHDVASPSLKGMLLDVTAGAYSRSNELEGRRRISVALCDGSAGWRPWLVHEAGERAGVALGGVERTGLGAVPWPIMTTRHGVAGRDFESGGGTAESPRGD